ncbi:MAG: LysM peptidoglycan-binding domain-containing protein [bacterium]|nr:LysM peptidoglycan-binding domain-containing protein [bacterium]
MKQNERILVYLVTGFLAVILVVAVFFGRDGNAAHKPASGDQVRGLGQLIGRTGQGGEGAPNGGVPGGSVGEPGGAQNGSPRNGGAADPANSITGGNGSPAPLANGGPAAGTPASGDGRSPLSSAGQVPSLPVAASARVLELLGESRRDRTVRIVRARAGDSLESLVRRWCGKRQPFLEEARSLNEQLTILRLGQEVVVPWVDDEVVLAAFEARQPRLLSGDDIAPGGTSSTTPVTTPNSSAPSFRVPASGGPAAGEPVGGASTPQPAAAGATVEYTVKPNDALWKIAAKRYGARNADRKVREIKDLNGLSSNNINVGQKLLLPAAN